MVADDIALGRLVEVLSEWTPSYPGYRLYYSGRRRIAASLCALVDLAQEIILRNRAKGLREVRDTLKRSNGPLEHHLLDHGSCHRSP
jgi:hypothetical protein